MKNYTQFKIIVSLLLTALTSSLSLAQNAGIGTSTPSMTLDIEGSRADEGIHINNTNTANRAIIQFQDAGTGKFTLGVDLADDIFKLGTTALGTNTRLKIDANGNVCIGASPDFNQKFQVYYVGASGGIRVRNDDAGDGDPVVEFCAGAGSNFVLGVDDSDADKFKISGGGTLGTNDRFTIDGSGKIGIATAAPSEQLHVSGNIRVTGQYLDSDNASGTDGQILTKVSGAVKWANAGAGTTWSLTGNASTNPTNNFVGTTDAQDLVFRTNNAERIRVLSGGNVGIGVNNPGMKLAISSAGSQDGIKIVNTDATNGDAAILFSTEGGDKFTIGVRDPNSQNFHISRGGNLNNNDLTLKQSDGNVGVGASSAIQKLHVQTSGSSDGMVIENLNAGDGDPTLRFDLNGAIQAFTMGVDDSDADKFKISGGSALGTNDRLVIDGNGNLGINQASPTSKLHLNGSMAVVVSGQSGTYTMGANDFYVYANSGSGAVTINLPAKAGCTGRMYMIRRGGVNTVTIDPDGAETIDGAATFNVTDGKTVFIINDGGDWKRIITE